MNRPAATPSPMSAYESLAREWHRQNVLLAALARETDDGLATRLLPRLAPLPEARPNPAHGPRRLVPALSLRA